jgi:hypothetical protein
MLEGVFGGVHRLRQERGQPASEQARKHAAGHRDRPDERRMRCHGKQRPEADDVAAHHGGSDTRQRDRDDAAWLPLEEQQFDGEKHRGERGREGGRHAGRRSGHQERLSFGAGEVQELGDERAHGAAGHDDRPFGAERPAGADRNRRRQWLEQRDLRLDAAAVDENRFDRLRNAVAADPARSVAGHQADEQRAGHRDGDDPWTDVGGLRRDQGSADTLEEEQVREQPDQRQQRFREVGADDAEDEREAGDRQQARRGREIAQLAGDVARRRRLV